MNPPKIGRLVCADEPMVTMFCSFKLGLRGGTVLRQFWRDEAIEWSKELSESRSDLRWFEADRISGLSLLMKAVKRRSTSISMVMEMTIVTVVRW